MKAAKIDLGGLERCFVLDGNALAAFEEATGSNMMKQESWTALKEGIDFKMIRTFAWAMLQSTDPPPAIREVGGWINIQNAAAVASKIIQAITGTEFPVDDARSLAPFVPTPEMVIERMLDIAELKAGETLVDPGCGDGRVLAAALKRGASAIGYELNVERAALAHENAPRATIHVSDAMDGSFDADVVFLYLLTTSNAKLLDKLQRELRPGARVVSHDFDGMIGWTPYMKETLAGDNGRAHTIYAWRMNEAHAESPAA